jgi:hypothetical protein
MAAVRPAAENAEFNAKAPSRKGAKTKTKTHQTASTVNSFFIRVDPRDPRVKIRSAVPPFQG